MSDSITLLFDSRQEADYDLEEDITQHEAENLINKAKEIYLQVNAYFQELVNEI